MKRIRVTSLAATLLLAACSAAPAAPPGPSASTTPSGPPAAAADWPQPNAGYDNQRRASSSSVSSANVDSLGVAWTFTDLESSNFGALATNPIVVDGIAYLEDLNSNLYAVDLDDGSLVWEQSFGIGQLGPNGVAVDGGLVFATVGAYEVAAFDASDGAELWRRSLQTQNETERITIQPVVFDDTVYVSTGSSSFDGGGVAGILYALDAETGEERWSFSTIEDEGLWGNPEINSGGGAWYPPAIDVEDGTTFWGIANPAPFPGTPDFPNGSSRPGDNLYTSSILAIDARGELRWYDQVVPHDLFDRDFQSSPILATATIGGAERDVVIGSGKVGVVNVYDRANGTLLWEQEVGRHTDATSPIAEGEEREVYPGALGGVETPIAFADGVVYAPYVDAPTTWSESTFGGVDFASGRGGLAALDLATETVLWDVKYPSLVLGGATVVNDLVLTGTFAGELAAHDRQTGEKVWSMTLPAGINGWMAVAGDTILVPAGVGASPMLVALRLGASGTLPIPGASEGPGSPSGAPSPSAEADGTINIATRQTLTFDRTEITVPAGTEVTLTYLNDEPVPHNVHVFAGESEQAETLAQTEIITGPRATTSVTFTTPTEPGRYLFICDVHPSMRGFLIVGS